jgi:hypothetical protein
MRKIYTLFIACIFAVAAIAQDATFYKIPDGFQFTIDGVVDDFWGDVEAYNVDQAYTGDANTFTLDKCTWQAVWNDTVIVVLVIVEEDSWAPSWVSGLAGWQSDKPEVYFDVNATLADADGPVNNGATPNGHFQIAPDPYGCAGDTCWITTDTAMAFASAQFHLGTWFGYVIDEPDETWEYAAIIDSIIDENGVVLDPYAAPIIGFDVTFIDCDEGDTDRKRAVWMNTGATNESWNNMDDCGEITFSTDWISGIYTPQVSNLNVYPNPAMDYLQIEADFNEVVITNIIGQEALILRDIKGTRIDISGLESGLYFISLYNNSKYIGTARFTVQ